MIIRNNLFVNFGSSAVEASGATDPAHYASGNTTIAGNIFDMTCVGQKAVSRTAINVSANDTHRQRQPDLRSRARWIRWSPASGSASRP